MYEGTITIVCANDPAELERVQHVATRFCELHEVRGRDLHAITLALDELLTNIVHYAFPDRAASHQIVVRLEHAGGVLAARIEDDGQPFDPRGVPPVDVTKPLHEREIGGLGIHLVRSLMTSLEYQREGSRNIVTITRRLPPRG